LPRLRDVTPEERPQIPRGLTPYADLGIDHARGVQVGQLGGKAIAPRQLLAQPLADHARGGVAIGQGRRSRPNATTIMG
jgi:hypothetical protein